MWTVHYHGDGGQACFAATREFTNRDDAMCFAEAAAREEGHYCTNSVWVVGEGAEDMMAGLELRQKRAKGYLA